MNDSVLEMKSVHKSFKEKHVLQGVTLQVPKGTVMGLLGKNGAGKTTLIKCALGLMKPQAGEISVFGEPAWTLSAQVKERIGYVPQTVELYKWMKVYQVINYTASFYPKWNHDLAARFQRDLELNRNDRIRELSGGQLQRLGLLLALGHEPDLLVLDEPAASLDPAARRQFLSLVLEIVAHQQRTVLFSTHLTSDLERVADSVAILKNGSVDYVGGLDELKDSVKKLRIVGSKIFPTDFTLPGLIHMERNGKEALLSIRGVTPEIIRKLEIDWSASVEVRDLTLEDIFVEMHHG